MASGAHAPSEYIGICRKNQGLSDFSNRLWESRKYLIFNGTTSHCIVKNIFILNRAAKSLH